MYFVSQKNKKLKNNSENIYIIGNIICILNN